MKKAFFFDIDGTLVHKIKDKLLVSDKNLQAIIKLRKQGYKTFIATGRAHDFIPPSIIDLPMDGFITANGSVVEVNNKVIVEKLFPKSSIQIILNFCEKYNYNWLLEGKFAYTNNLKSKSLIDFYKNVVVNKSRIFEMSCNNINDKIIYNILIFGNTTNIVSLQDELGDGFIIAPHFKHGYLDCYLKGNTKADGIDKVIKHMRLEDHEIYAFGDGNNDIEMFDRADVAIAMKNASNELKIKANVVTKANYDNGVYHALVNLNLID